MTPEHFTPIHDLQAQTDRITINLPFPSWVESHLIAVDVSETLRLMNLGGIAELRLIGRFHQQSSSIIPIAVSLNADGSSSAGAGSAKESVPIIHTDTHEPTRRSILKNNDWAFSTIHLNLNELQQILEGQNADLRKATS